MKLTRKKASIVKSAVESGIIEKTIPGNQGRKLLETIELNPFDWKRLADSFRFMSLRRWK